MAKETYKERQVREDAERQVVAATLPQLAALLGATLVKREGDSHHLIGDGYTLHVYHATWKGRLHISGIFDHHLQQQRRTSGSQADPELLITVDPHRPAPAIAQDIRRRLLPDYLALHHQLHQRHAKYTREETAKQTQAQRIAYAGQGQIIGERDPWRRNEFYPRRVILFGGGRFGGDPSGEAEITGIERPSISMKLYNLTPELAEYIASLLGEYTPEQEQHQ
jgi:hypothetical protein